MGCCLGPAQLLLVRSAVEALGSFSVAVCDPVVVGIECVCVEDAWELVVPVLLPLIVVLGWPDVIPA